MDIPTLTQKRWWFTKKAGALNSAAIAKWFAKRDEYYAAFRDILIRLRKHSESEFVNQNKCDITHDMIVDIMLNEIDRKYGKETWRIVRNNITYKTKLFYEPTTTEQGED